VRRAARLRRCSEFVGDILQILTKRSKTIRADIAPQDNLAIRGHGDNQVRKLKAAVLLALADERISFAKYFLKDGSGVLGHAAI
jgi:hypothetical protein